MRLLARLRKPKVHLSHSIVDYQNLVREKLRVDPENRSLALAQAIGAPTMESFHTQGDGHVAVLKVHGLSDGMAVYDLGCGCGRTAQALQRSGWRGSYTGADVVPELLAELADKLRIPGSSRAPFRIDGAQDSETIARSVPRIIRAAFRDDRAQFGMT